MLLIDGSHLLHRVLHTPLYDMVNDEGTRIGGLHGFISSLSSAVRSAGLKSGSVVAWDLNCSSYRLGLLPSYKERDRPMLVDGHFDFSKVKDESTLRWEQTYAWTRQTLHDVLLPLMGCISLQRQGIEADDFIYQISTKVSGPKRIISGDKDMLQMLTQETTVYDPIKKKLYTPEILIQEFDLLPDRYREHFILMKAIIGDDSDNIQGVDGVSWKWGSKFAKILLETGSLSSFEPEKRKKDKALIDNFDLVKRNVALIDLSCLPEVEVKEVLQHVYSTAMLEPPMYSDFNLMDHLRRLGLSDTYMLANDICEANFNAATRQTLIESLENMNG